MTLRSNFPCSGTRLCRTLFQLLNDFLNLSPQSFGDGFPQDCETSVLTPTCIDVGKAQELKSFRLSFTSFRPVFSGKTAKLYQTGLLRIQLQPKPLHASLQSLVNRFCITSVLKPHYKVIDVTHDVDLAPSVALPPRFRPQIKHVVQVNICQQRRNIGTLWCPYHRACTLPVLGYPILEPLRRYRHKNHFWMSI